MIDFKGLLALQVDRFSFAFASQARNCNEAISVLW